VQTIFLCVWQAIHLNIPPPGEAPYKQILRRIGWSILAVIAPEVVALNAWFQYREAKRLTYTVNRRRQLRQVRVPQTWLQQLLGYLRDVMGGLGMLCLWPVLVVDQIRMLFRHTRDSRAFKSEQRRLRINDVLSRLERDQLPWTMNTAFYALCGGGVVLVDHHVKTLDSLGYLELARKYPKSLLPLQRAVLQDPSKASGLAKFITCAQAFWFCSQCIARLSQDMAISLLELNTFAHCISAFFIYVFWWHKPYDVATHVYIESTEIAMMRPDLVLEVHLSFFTQDRSPNMSREMFSSEEWAWAGVFRPLIMFLAFLVYGAIHSLAWEYHFPTNAEGIIWRCASVATASSGLIILLIIVRERTSYSGTSRKLLHGMMYFLCFVAIAARSFLVVESFRALANSPASIYEVPRWTAYIPHI
jgi:hypothetical protein